MDRLVDGARRRHVRSVGGEVREALGCFEDCMRKIAGAVFQKLV